MAKVAEGIGKNYEEAVADALNKVGLTKEQVSIEIIEEPKKRIFSILDPKQVKVRVTEITQPESANYENKKVVKELNAKQAEVDAMVARSKRFFAEGLNK